MAKPISQSWYEAAAIYVDAEAAANALEETKSAILSQWIYEQGDMPVSKAEMLVKASKRWHDHVTTIVNARTAANKAKIKAEYWRLKFYEWQSTEANHRLETKMSD